MQVRKPDRLALVVLIAAATIVSGAFLLRPTDLHLPACSEPWDAAIVPWNFFWLDASFEADRPGSLLFTRQFFWPDGEGLGLYTPTWVYSVLALPFRWFGESPGSGHAAVAALLLLSSVATALLAYALARELSLRPASAVLVALLATVASGRLMNAARLNLFCTELLLLYLLLGLRLWKRGGLALGAGFGFAAALLFLQSQPLAFQAGLLTTLLALAASLRRGTRATLRARLKPIAAASIVALLLCGPFLWQIAVELPHTPGFAQAAALTVQGSLDPAELVVPSRADRFAGIWSHVVTPRAPSFFEEGGPLGSVSHFLGLGWIALLVVALLAAREKAGRRALLLGLAVLLLAVGPLLRFLGTPIPLPMPYALLSYVPPLALEKSPARLVWLVQLFFAIAAARGFERLAFAADGHWRRGGGALAISLAALLLLEQGETVPLRSIEPRLRIPDEIAAMAREPGSFAVLDLPYDSRPPHGSVSHAVNALAMAFGAAHEHPIFFGLYPRAARLHEAELAARPLFAAIHGIEADCAAGRPPALGGHDPAAIRRDLDELEIGAVLVHDLAIVPERPPGSGEREALRRFLRGLGPREEKALSAGKGYSVTLFRF